MEMKNRNTSNSRALPLKTMPVVKTVIAFISAVVFFLLIDGRVVAGSQPPGETAGLQDGALYSIHIEAQNTGIPMELLFNKGKEHNHPLMAVWIEDNDSNYIQTVYVAESIGKGYFRYGDTSSGRWMPGPVRRPAALPYWGHQRGIRAEDGYYLPTQDDPVPDAITGPTPKSSFVIHFNIPDMDTRQFRILFEINQSWDWNDYWTNDKFPGDEHYMSSSQPALVYEARVDLDSGKDEYTLLPIGHSHWSGQNGNLYTDLGTITTALEISESIILRVP